MNGKKAKKLRKLVGPQWRQPGWRNFYRKLKRLVTFEKLNPPKVAK